MPMVAVVDAHHRFAVAGLVAAARPPATIDRLLRVAMSAVEVEGRAVGPSTQVGFSMKIFLRALTAARVLGAEAGRRGRG
ncbi:MAG: hypothetical protein U0793_24985 [Gemmataceae bacterium]